MIVQCFRACTAAPSTLLRAAGLSFTADVQSISRLPVARSQITPSKVTIRHASHGAAGRANGPKNGPGKRLGAKRTGDEYVIPGTIIFRQRGTEWHPGHNCARGRDHTIYATESGYVKYYRDPKNHPKRRFIGVVFNRADTLPLDRHAPRQRRLNMTAVPRQLEESIVAATSAIGIIPNPADPIGQTVSVAQAPAEPRARLTKSQLREARQKLRSGRAPVEELRLTSNYDYRETNYSIGRAAERAQIQVKEFKPGDRFAAWRKTVIRRQRRALRMQVGRKKSSNRKGKTRK